MDHVEPEQILWISRLRKRKSGERTRNEFLRKNPFFENLSDKQLKVLAQHLQERSYQENEFIFEANHPGAALFIIVSGEVSVETQGTQQLALIQAGEFIGELALLDGSPRSASARATQPTKAFALFRGDLESLTKEEPMITTEIYRGLAWVIGERLKAFNRKIDIQKKAA